MIKTIETRDGEVSRVGPLVLRSNRGGCLTAGCLSPAGWLPTLGGVEGASLPWDEVTVGGALLSQQWMDWPSPPA